MSHVGYASEQSYLVFPPDPLGPRPAFFELPAPAFTAMAETRGSINANESEPHPWFAPRSKLRVASIV